MDAIDLAVLDDAQPLDLDPSLWSANLAALRAEQPELARQLEGTPLPSHWRPVAALDGFPTYRVEPAGCPAQWLAGTAAPLTRAGALLRHDQLGERNPALPTVAAGAELKLLLERLTVRQAVFVFEENATQLAAVSRTLDLSGAITSGRCILVPPHREQAFLEQLLERYPGLLPPGTIVTLPSVSGERLQRLRTLCEAVAQQVSDTRNRRLHALTDRIPTRAAGAGGGRDTHPGRRPRLAVVALSPGLSSHQLSRELAEAAERLNWTACCCAATGPREAHALPHCQRLVAFAAQLSICIDHRPESLPLAPGKTVCQWHLHTKDVPDSLGDDDSVHLAATPRIAQALRAAGVSEARLVDFYWAYAVKQARTASCERSPRTVALVADLPDAGAAACRIEQPTHKRLWAQLHRTIGKAWETTEVTQPVALLGAAERTSGVALGESSLRKQMVRIIEHVLIPAVVLERICQRLQENSFEVVAVGTGWDRCASESLEPLAESLRHLPEDARLPPVLAAVFAGPLDPLTPELFQAAGLDWPLLIHAPGGVSLTPRLGGILHPRQHYEPFAGRQDLLAALEAIGANPERSRARCAQVRAYLERQHTYAHRLTSLARQLGLDWPEAAA